MKYGIKPLGARVIVRKDEPSKQTPGGILLPDAVKNAKPVWAMVVAVGSGKLCDNGTRHPVEAVVGDHVLINPYAGSEIEVGGDTLHVLGEGEILAVEANK